MRSPVSARSGPTWLATRRFRAASDPSIGGSTPAPSGGTSVHHWHELQKPRSRARLPQSRPGGDASSCRCQAPEHWRYESRCSTREHRSVPGAEYDRGGRGVRHDHGSRRSPRGSIGSEVPVLTRESALRIHSRISDDASGPGPRRGAWLGAGSGGEPTPRPTSRHRRRADRARGVGDRPQDVPAHDADARSGSHSAVYEGVLVAEVLRRAGAPIGDLRGNTLTYVLASARDDHQVVFSLAELDPALARNTVIVADTVDGQDLGEDQRRLRIVVAGDQRPARSVRMLTQLSVVQLRK